MSGLLVPVSSCSCVPPTAGLEPSSSDCPHKGRFALCNNKYVHDSGDFVNSSQTFEIWASLLVQPIIALLCTEIDQPEEHVARFYERSSLLDVTYSVIASYFNMKLKPLL